MGKFVKAVATVEQGDLVVFLEPEDFREICTAFGGTNRPPTLLRLAYEARERGYREVEV